MPDHDDNHEEARDHDLSPDDHDVLDAAVNLVEYVYNTDDINVDHLYVLARDLCRAHEHNVRHAIDQHRYHEHVRHRPAQPADHASRDGVT